MPLAAWHLRTFTLEAGDLAGRSILRVALLTMMEPAGQEPAPPRAFLRVGGISLARHQLGLALTLGCERIVCIARGLPPELVGLQHVAEDHGARFHLVTGPRGLASLVTAADEVFVLADGLLAAPEDIAAQLGAGQGILVQAIELGQRDGFERIDLNQAAAGAMRIPGNLVERLTELPADCDAASSLQRIALQAGVPQRTLAAGLRESGTWRLVRDEGEAQIAEGEWFRQHTATRRGDLPSQMLAHLAVRSFGPALMHAGSGGNAVGLLALAAILLALGAGWLVYTATALIFCALADVLRHVAILLLRIERHSLSVSSSGLPRGALFGWGLDISLILILAWSQNRAASASPLDHAFPAIMLIVMLRLIPQLVDARWAVWLQDRGALALVLAVVIAAAGGMPAGLVAALAAALGGVAVAWSGRGSPLTRA